MAHVCSIGTILYLLWYLLFLVQLANDGGETTERNRYHSQEATPSRNSIKHAGFSRSGFLKLSNKPGFFGCDIAGSTNPRQHVLLLLLFCNIRSLGVSLGLGKASLISVKIKRIGHLF
jgi:hypothetical protein